MAQIKNLLSDLKQAEESFNNGLLKLSNDFEKQQEKENERVTLGNGELDAQSSDFGLFYCLSESLIQTERCISEKPSRELALVKTKLQEAIFWAKQSNH